MFCHFKGHLCVPGQNIDLRLSELTNFLNSTQSFPSRESVEAFCFQMLFRLHTPSLLRKAGQSFDPVQNKATLSSYSLACIQRRRLSGPAMAASRAGFAKPTL